MSYVIAYNRTWCRNLPERLEKKTGKNFVAIDNKKDLNRDSLNSINPEHIFFPHWSYLIPEDMKKGEILNEKNMRIVRPGLGLPPKYYDILLGRKVSQDVKKGMAVGWNLIG